MGVQGSVVRLIGFSYYVEVKVQRLLLFLAFLRGGPNDFFRQTSLRNGFLDTGGSSLRFVAFCWISRSAVGVPVTLLPGHRHHLRGRETQLRKGGSWSTTCVFALLWDICIACEVLDLLQITFLSSTYAQKQGVLRAVTILNTYIPKIQRIA